jgi:hypothetical protein
MAIRPIESVCARPLDVEAIIGQLHPATPLARLVTLELDGRPADG